MSESSCAEASSDQSWAEGGVLWGATRQTDRRIDDGGNDDKLPRVVRREDQFASGRPAGSRTDAQTMKRKEERIEPLGKVGGDRKIMNERE